MLHRCLLSIILCVALTAGADSWVHHLPFAGVDGITLTAGRVYFTSLGALYAHEPRNSTTLALSPDGYLNDVGVTGIFSRPDANVVAVAYASGNIDVIRDDATLINLPDITTSRLSPRLVIDAAFSPDVASLVVATGFGAVLFDLHKAEVRNYLRSSESVSAVAYIGSDPVLLIGGKWRGLKSGGSFSDLTEWEEIPASLIPSQAITQLPASISATCSAAYPGSSQVWVGTSDGLCSYDLSGSQPVLTAGPVRPGEMSVADVNMLRLAPSGNLYIATRGNSNVHINRATGNAARLCRLAPDGTFTDLTPRSLTSLSGKLPDESGRMFDITSLREDPDDPAMHYAGTLFEGFYALDGRDELCHFYLDNTAFADNWGVRVMDLAFDPRGGMWVYTEAPDDMPMIHFLPPAARQVIPMVGAADWTPVAFTAGVISGRDCTAVVSASGRYIYSMGSADIYVYDTAGTISLADDNGRWARTFHTADGTSLPVTRVCSIMEDSADGSLWIGTDIGVLVASRPWEVADGAITVHRPNINRDDGTSLADYLLPTDRIYGITTDPLGNKWIATEASGAFLVSPDGTDILRHFTSANSPLPTDDIRAVACRPDGTVFFGTAYGLIEYQSDFRPAAAEVSDVLIYPNPVRPDYLGDVTIDRLPEGAIVKIVDSGGRLVAQLRGEGGRFRWNPRDRSALPAGVYHIILSSPAQSGRPAGKLVIIR